NIGGCDIAVNDALFKCFLQRTTDMYSDAKSLAPIQHSLDANAANHRGHALAIDILHGAPTIRAILPGVIEFHDVGTFHRQHRSHGPHEPFFLLLAVRGIWPKYFDGRDT